MTLHIAVIGTSDQSCWLAQACKIPCLEAVILRFKMTVTLTVNLCQVANDQVINDSWAPGAPRCLTGGSSKRHWKYLFSLLVHDPRILHRNRKDLQSCPRTE